MGALLLAVLVTLIGGWIGVALALRHSAPSSEDPRRRLARWTVIVLAGTAGALIASQLYALAHELQIDGQAPYGGGELKLIDVETVTRALRDILFNGLTLIAFAVLIELAAGRRGSSAKAPAPGALP